MQKTFSVKKVRPSKIKSYLEVNAWVVGDNKVWYQNVAKAYHNKHEHYTGYIIASYRCKV